MDPNQPQQWSSAPQLERSVAGTALIGKACDVLDIVASAGGGITRAELAQKTHMPRATLYRILGALSARGLIRSDPHSQSYSLGFRLLEYTQNIWASGDIVSISASELRRIRDITGETAYLAVLHGTSVFGLGRFEGAHSRRSAAQLGSLKPLHCTSQGKAILACLPETQVDALIGRAPLKAYTAKTIVAPDMLKAHLGVVRARGYAIDDEEIVEGTRCVGAAITDASGRAFAAISVAGPAYRMTSQRAEQLGPELADVARQISSLLRAPQPTVSARDHGFSVRPASDAVAFMGGSPLWNGPEQKLVWIDKLAPALHGLGRSAISLEHRAGSIDAAVLLRNGIGLAVSGKLIIATDDGEIERSGVSLPANIRAFRTDASGRTWAAVFDERDIVSRIGPVSSNGDLDVIFDVPGEVAGLVFDREGRVLYASVPERGSIYALGTADGTRRVLSRIPKVSGGPCGLAIDGNNSLWVALWEGWSIARLDPEGEIAQIIALPVPGPTGLAFGGEDLSALYITTARSNLPLESLQNAPLSGRLLVCSPGVSGVPETPSSAW